MAGLKEIRRRLKSVNNTKKITYAMKLVSAAKLRKTQESAMRSRAYSDAILEVLSDIIGREGAADFPHPFLEARPQVRNVRLVVLGGARGLCGAYNTNINRKIEAFHRDQQAKRPGVNISWTLLGRKPAEYFRRIGRSYDEALEALPDDPLQWPVDDLSKAFELEFLAGELDEVYVLYMKFRSAISMSATIERLLPLDAASPLFTSRKSESASAVVTKYEPSIQDVFNALLPRIVRSIIRQAALETKASEHASRMTAMDAATKNAKELIYSLTLTRNKLRQAGITNQLLDIVGGAEAVQ
jgi:F-type H+-transporting ATPase subunit gamma